MYDARFAFLELGLADGTVAYQRLIAIEILHRQRLGGERGPQLGFALRDHRFLKACLGIQVDEYGTGGSDVGFCLSQPGSIVPVIDAEENIAGLHN
jgi:hypothetical protein